jgi:hypothetical protein
MARCASRIRCPALKVGDISGGVALAGRTGGAGIRGAAARDFFGVADNGLARSFLQWAMSDYIRAASFRKSVRAVGSFAGRAMASLAPKCYDSVHISARCGLTSRRELDSN